MMVYIFVHTEYMPFCLKDFLEEKSDTKSNMDKE